MTEATDRLIEFPASGWEIPEIGKDNYREIIYGSYRIMYKTEDLKIYILAVAHAARNWQFDFE
ncbi:MAG: type II toxin-antitoxin system RelE/ParE family toxin [Ignavibacteria bacterium]|nr:type II toxin-antitoxin system RelE/ParE family toxin [Ignavibacteria bacterium]